MIIIFKPLQTTHFPLLLKWLGASHVKAWWCRDVRWTPELIKEKYESYVQGYKVDKGIKKPLQAYIIYADDRPIGYIQLYNAHDFPRGDRISLEGLPASLAAFDIFLGEEAYVGQGLGTRIIKQFLREKIDPVYDACLVDPHTANGQAMRAYEKAGFTKVKPLKRGALRPSAKVSSKKDFCRQSITWMIREKIQDV